MKTIGLLSLLLTACSWTVFDDLEDSTWVTSTEKPDNDASNWGVAIQRGQLTGTGGRLVVMGANQALYSELVVDPSGKVSVAPTTLQLNSQFGIGNLEAQPLLIADPTGNDVALVTPSGGASIAVLEGALGTLGVYQVFGPTVPDAATFMTPVAPASTTSQVLVGAGDTVYGAESINNMQPSCKLVDDAMAAVEIRALGATPSMMAGDNVLVWAGGGKLLRYPPGVFSGTPAGCAAGLAPGMNAVGTTSFMPGKGSQILTFEVAMNRYAVLQGHTDTGSGFLALFDVATMMPVGSPRTETGLRTAALIELAGKRYIIAGYPAAIVDGTSGAGQVQVFEVDATAGITGPILTLHDAQPESNQQFGRSVAAMPFDNRQALIVVAADNEVFTYFRTTLYADTRAGR